jgi:1,4-alpha-glucan branching enzyme
MNVRSLKQKQSFFFKAPAARSVLLAGDFTSWLKSPIRLRKGADGVWTTTIMLAPGAYHYRFVVDGDWHDYPECSLRVQDLFGMQNNAVQIGSLTPEIQGDTKKAAGSAKQVLVERSPSEISACARNQRPKP